MMMDLYSFKTIGWLTLFAALIIAGCAAHQEEPSEPPTPTTITNTGVSITAPGVNIQVKGTQP